MNILYVTTHLNVGGITSYLLTVASGFVQRGHKVYIASSGGDVLPLFTNQGIVHIPIPIRTKSELNLVKILLSVRRLVQQVREKQIEVIHSQTRVTNIVAALVSKQAKIAHVTTCHGFFKNRLSRRIYPCWGDRVIAISESVKQHLIHELSVDEKYVRLVYNGIDLDKYRRLEDISAEEKSSYKQSFGLGLGPVIGIIARLSTVKGHVYLIQAMKKITARYPDAQLCVMGEGRILASLQKLTQELGLGQNVRFIPKITDMVKALSAIDVFVMPSLAEGLGLSLMEAMAAGLPCVGSEVGGIRDLIRHQQNGLLVKPQDPAGIAMAVIELLSDCKKAKELGQNARMFVNHHFSQAQMLMYTQEVYRQCLKE